MVKNADEFTGDLKECAQCRECLCFMPGVTDLNLRFYCEKCLKDCGISEEENGIKRPLKII